MKMWKLLIFAVLSTLIWVSHEVSQESPRGIENLDDDNDSIEIPVRKQSNSGFSVFRPADDAIFNFINKLVNTTYLSSRMALNRARAQTETRHRIEDEVEDFVEHLPNIPIPLLDDLYPIDNHNHNREQKSGNLLA